MTDCKCCGAPHEQIGGTCGYCGTSIIKTEIKYNFSSKHKLALINKIFKDFFKKPIRYAYEDSWSDKWKYYTKLPNNECYLQINAITTVKKYSGFWNKTPYNEKVNSWRFVIGIFVKNDNQIAYDNSWCDLTLKSQNKKYNEYTKALANKLAEYTNVSCTLQ